MQTYLPLKKLTRSLAGWDAFSTLATPSIEFIFPLDLWSEEKLRQLTYEGLNVGHLIQQAGLTLTEALHCEHGPFHLRADCM